MSDLCTKLISKLEDQKTKVYFSKICFCLNFKKLTNFEITAYLTIRNGKE